MLGQYYAFDDADTGLGTRAFYWSTDDGFYDLGALVEGGLSAAGWEQLWGVYGANGTSAYGVGRPLSMPSQLVFVISPVPEPGAVALTASAALLLLRRRRRRLAP